MGKAADEPVEDPSLLHDAHRRYSSNFAAQCSILLQLLRASFVAPPRSSSSTRATWQFKLPFSLPACSHDWCSELCRGSRPEGLDEGQQLGVDVRRPLLLDPVAAALEDHA